MNSAFKIGIVDYGAGNIRSITNALDFLDYEYGVVAEPEQLRACNTFILPGVGAFAEAMKRLQSSGLAEALQDQVSNHNKPLLGICLGLQLLGQSSTENGFHEGFGWIDAIVDRLPEDGAARVPHVGWNDISFRDDDPLFQNIETGTHFFFDHSFHMTCADPSLVCATTRFGTCEIVAAVKFNNVVAYQFHPERSQNNGLRLYRNFLNHAEQLIH
jgi:glutamine amidotransferase